MGLIDKFGEKVVDKLIKLRIIREKNFTFEVNLTLILSLCNGEIVPLVMKL